MYSHYNKKKDLSLNNNEKNPYMLTWYLHPTFVIFISIIILHYIVYSRTTWSAVINKYEFDVRKHCGVGEIFR